MISAELIGRIAGDHRVESGIVEKDYVLSKALSALSGLDELQNSLVFKGGTALKKCYYPDWRYSEDLDFTATRPITSEAVRTLFEQVTTEVGDVFGMSMRVIEYSQYPRGAAESVSAQLKLGYDGPLRKTSGFKNNVRVDIAFSERLVKDPVRKPLIPTYPDDPATTLQVYALEEIVAEKLRSILQRGKSRDYYDVWVLLKQYKKDIVVDEVLSILQKKCKFKGMTDPSVADFFSPDRVNEAAPFWERGLAHQVDQLPAFDSVVSELRGIITQILPE